MAAPTPLPIPPTSKANHPSSTPNLAYGVPSSAGPRGDMATMRDHRVGAGLPCPLWVKSGAVTKIRDLNDHGFFFERQITQSVHHILVRVRDRSLAGTDLIGQHGDLVHRCKRHRVKNH